MTDEHNSLFVILTFCHTSQHPFIVDLIYAFQTGGKLYLILEYLSGMSCQSYIILNFRTLY